MKNHVQSLVKEILEEIDPDNLVAGKSKKGTSKSITLSGKMVSIPMHGNEEVEDDILERVLDDVDKLSSDQRIYLLQELVMHYRGDNDIVADLIEKAVECLGSSEKDGSITRKSSDEEKTQP